MYISSSCYASQKIITKLANLWWISNISHDDIFLRVAFPAMEPLRVDHHIGNRPVKHTQSRYT